MKCIALMVSLSEFLILNLYNSLFNNQYQSKLTLVENNKILSFSLKYVGTYLKSNLNI